MKREDDAKFDERNIAVLNVEPELQWPLHCYPYTFPMNRSHFSLKIDKFFRNLSMLPIITNLIIEISIHSYMYLSK